jgi:hypothetical protein
MPKILKDFLCLSALDMTLFCATGIGLMLHQEPRAQAAEQTLALRQQAAHRTAGATQDMAGGQLERADLEACADAVREDYSDDPQRAFWRIRTVCHQ